MNCKMESAEYRIEYSMNRIHKADECSRLAFGTCCINFRTNHGCSAAADGGCGDGPLPLSARCRLAASQRSYQVKHFPHNALDTSSMSTIRTNCVSQTCLFSLRRPSATSQLTCLWKMPLNAVKSKSIHPPPSMISSGLPRYPG